MEGTLFFKEKDYVHLLFFFLKKHLSWSWHAITSQDIGGQIKAETLLARGSYGMEYGSPNHFLLIFPFAFTALAYATFPRPSQLSQCKYNQVVSWQNIAVPT